MALHLLLLSAPRHRMRRGHRAEDQRVGPYCQALVLISELKRREYQDIVTYPMS